TSPVLWCGHPAQCPRDLDDRSPQQPGKGVDPHGSVTRSDSLYAVRTPAPHDPGTDGRALAVQTGRRLLTTRTDAVGIVQRYVVSNRYNGDWDGPANQCGSVPSC